MWNAEKRQCVRGKLEAFLAQPFVLTDGPATGFGRAMCEAQRVLNEINDFENAPARLDGVCRQWTKREVYGEAATR